MFLYLAISIIYKYSAVQSSDWNLYTCWAKYVATIYFFVVSIFSLRRVHYCPQPDAMQPLLDPSLTALVNNLLNLLAPVAFVASGLSGFMHNDFVYEDHAVSLFVVVEMILNTFQVGAGDIFLSVSFSFLYICFVWITSAVLVVSEWPHNIFKPSTSWSILSYNIFILAHVVCFVVYYVIMTRLCRPAMPHAKVCAQEREEKYSSIQASGEEDDSVTPIKPSSRSKPQQLLVQDIESNTSEDTSAADATPVPAFVSDPVMSEADKRKIAEAEAANATLLAQMIAERTERKRVQAEATQLRQEVLQLQEVNARENVKLKKVVDRLGEREVQLRGLEGWLSAKNDEELVRIKMQMADKLNEIAHRPKTGGGGDHPGRHSALHHLDAKAPVQTKNLQALSTLRHLKMKKLTADRDAHEDSWETLEKGEEPITHHSKMFQTI